MRFNGSVSGGVSGMMEILGEGDTISITPALSSGVEVATFKINEGTAEEETIKLYAPNSISWDNITNKPNLFSGSYGDLSNKPTLNGVVINGNMFTHNYSTSEQRVGSWIDGKPLYQKTVSFPADSSQRLSINLGVQNVEHIFLVPDGCFGNAGTWTIPYVIGTDYNNNIGGYFDNLGAGNTATFEFRVGQGSAPYNNGGYITVRYTKTTDVI